VFRDWLRTHPEDRDAYGTLKLKLAESADLQRLEERVRYSHAKGAFVREIERRALTAYPDRTDQHKAPSWDI
jgi:GrpB-like predicted nucleotidyltransferase (UPF0157 family)